VSSVPSNNIYNYYGDDMKSLWLFLVLLFAGLFYCIGLAYQCARDSFETGRKGWSK
jgi:hypothetical protein